MKIKRRQFLILSSFLGLSPYIGAQEFSKFEKDFKKVKATIAAVQEQMFPKGSQLPSAAEMNVTTFLFETVAHKSFDTDIRAFVIEGAEELIRREKSQFSLMPASQREDAMRAYEETNYGSSWLARIMTLTMEGLFCDPVYGSNIKEAGWKALGAFGGQPRPNERYLDV